jgi:hypothetical protein
MEKKTPFLGGDFDHHRLAMASLWLATKVRLGDDGMMRFFSWGNHL